MPKITRKKTSSDKVKNNNSVSKSVKLERNRGGGVKEVLKEEEYNAEEQSVNRSNPANMLREGQALIGLSKGCTINMGNYQSAKIDVWISRVCKDNEFDIMNNLAEIGNILDEQIEYETGKLNEE